MTFLFWTFVALYAGLLVSMALLQRRLMYHPVRPGLSPQDLGLSGFDEHTIRTADGVSLQLWHRAPATARATILYFHGNAGNLGDRASIFAALAAQGLGVTAVCYRGYGKSEGTPTEEGLYHDARAAIAWLKSRGVGLSNIAFYGESLGTGVAVRMATEYTPKHLFLQAPYTSIVERGAEIYWFVPVRFLLRDRFESIAHIHQVQSPILAFHGRCDDVIPPHHTEKLLEYARTPKRAVFFDTVGHADFDVRCIAEHVVRALG